MDDLDSGAPWNNRQGLSEVTNKEDGDASKQWNIINILALIFEKVFQSTIDCFWTIAVLHRSFIPYDEFCFLEDTMHIVTLCHIACGCLINGNGNFEA